MARVRALGYAVLETSRLAEWVTFARDGLGMHVDEVAGGARFRLDSMAYRFDVRSATDDRVVALGWQVRDERELDEIAARLHEGGYSPASANAGLLHERGVSGLVTVSDPSGHKLEIFYGPNVTQAPLSSSRGMRFVTEPMGLGHALVSVTDMAASLHFYLDTLRMRISDRVSSPGEVEDAYFLRCNPRHHSLGLVSVPGLPAQPFHFMVETVDLDDVGRAFYEMVDSGAPLTTNLGRHSNDRMLSFYVRTPSGFDIELGWGGKQIDERTHVETRGDTESDWGHRRTTANRRGAEVGSDR